MSSSAADCIRVCVRVRPLNSAERGKMEKIVRMDEQNGVVTIIQGEGQPGRQFNFDQVFDDNTEQQVVYDRTASYIVQSIFDGYNGTIFAYGQTGTGKTYTMEGAPDAPGIIPHAFQHIFGHIGTIQGKQFVVSASFLEIYNEDIRDLLVKNPNRLDLRESKEQGVYVQDLKKTMVKSVEEIDVVMRKGNRNRTVGATKMNAQSSRSHSIFTINIETITMGPDGEPMVRAGKLNLVDLAGSERQSKTGAEGDRLKEATKINLSLSALGNVINALTSARPGQHVPYRDSKLTRLLQDSLGGNTKTTMIANIGPADWNIDETITTLRYATRAKKIANKPTVNYTKNAMFNQLQDEIDRLRQQLQDMETKTTTATGIDETLLQELQHNAEMEKAAIESEKAQVEQDRQRIAKELEENRQRLEVEREEKEHVALRLKAMEDQLIQGGINVADRARQQEQELQEYQAQIREQHERELRMRLELEEREKSQLIVEDRYNSLNDEIDVKTKKLKKLWINFQAAKKECEDLQSEFDADRADMLDTIRELQAQLKLKMQIIQHFIPMPEVEKIERRAVFDEETQEWKLARLEHAGNNLRPRRPESAGGMTIQGGMARGYRAPDHMLQLDLDMPARTTRDYDMPTEAQTRVQAALDEALSEEADAWFEPSESLPNVYFSYSSADGSAPPAPMPPPRPRSNHRPESAMRKTRHYREDETRTYTTHQPRHSPTEPQFPKSRGLVKSAHHRY